MNLQKSVVAVFPSQSVVHSQNLRGHDIGEIFLEDINKDHSTILEQNWKNELINPRPQ